MKTRIYYKKETNANIFIKIIFGKKPFHILLYIYLTKNKTTLTNIHKETKTTIKQVYKTLADLMELGLIERHDTPKTKNLRYSYYTLTSLGLELSQDLNNMKSKINEVIV